MPRCPGWAGGLRAGVRGRSAVFGQVEKALRALEGYIAGEFPELEEEL